MTVRSLSLTVRSLRDVTRQRGTYVIRGLLILALIFAIFMVHERERYITFGGPILLGFVAWGNWILISLGAISTFSALITEEKELMTLGLLRLAGFTPMSIILGKSAGTIATVLLLMVVQVPFCVLALAFGGISLDQIQAVFSVLFAYALFVYGLALFFSVVCARSFTAALATLITLLAYHAIPPILVELLQLYGGNRSGGVLDGLKAFFLGWNQTVAMQILVRAAGPFGGFGALEYSSAVVVNVITGLGCLLAAWSAFHFVSLEPAAATRPARGLARLFESARIGRRFGRNPIREKDYFLLSGGLTGLIIRCLLYGTLVIVIVAVQPRASARQLAEMIMGWGLFFVVLELGLQAERVFRSEVRDRTWGTLYALPVGLGRVVGSKVLGALYRVIPAVLLVLVGASFHPETVGEGFEDFVVEPIAWFFFWQIVFGLVLTVYFSLGSYRGALVRAVAVHLFFNFVFALLMSLGSPSMATTNGVCAILATAFALAIFPLLQAIGARLRALAGE